MLVQAKDIIQLSRVLLLSMEVYQGLYITAGNLPFYEAMLNLIEQPNMDSVVNQVNQLIRNYNCSVHLPLWPKQINQV